MECVSLGRPAPECASPCLGGEEVSRSSNGAGSKRDYSKYAQPGPILKDEQWYGMTFYPTETNPTDGPFWTVGMVFRTPNYAKQVFEAIVAWTAGEQQGGLPLDRDNRIGISFILEHDSDYSAYIYPTL